MKNLVPQNDRVLIQYIEVDSSGEMFKTDKKTGLVLPNNKSSDVSKSGGKYEARVFSVGENVDLNKYKWKIGDKIIFNEYDIMKLQDEDDNIWGLTKAESIWATYE